MKEENKLILLACLQKRTEIEESKIKQIISQKLDWGYIVGELIHHRLSGYFISYLPENEKKYLYKEVNKQLSLIYNLNKYITMENMKFFSNIFVQFEKAGIKYAGLKGVIYNASMYEIGVRRSNDIDILIPETEIKYIDNILRNNGFIQSINNNREEASKQDKMIQRLKFHDLIPYYRNVDDSILIPYYKMDINFRVDNTKGGLTKKFFDYGTNVYEGNGYSVKGLRWETHLLHLCVHFAREASNSVWVKDKRDCMLYKLVDIENTIRYFGKEMLKVWLEKVAQFECDEDIFMTFFNLNKLYPNESYKQILKSTNVDESIVDKIKVIGTNDVMSREKDYIDESFDLNYCIDFSKNN